MSDGYPPNWDELSSKIYQRDNYTCQDCGAQGGYAGDVELHAHHITPKSQGGTHEPENLITLCASCHNDQHDFQITAGNGGSGKGGIDLSPVIYTVLLPIAIVSAYVTGGVVVLFQLGDLAFVPASLLIGTLGGIVSSLIPEKTIYVGYGVPLLLIAISVVGAPVEDGAWKGALSPEYNPIRVAGVLGGFLYFIFAPLLFTLLARYDMLPSVLRL